MSRKRPKSAAGRRASESLRTPQETKSRPRPTQPRSLEYDAAEVNRVLFPVGKRVRLASGSHVEIKPWSIKMFGEMSQRIPNVLEQAMASPDNAPAFSTMFDLFVDEVVYMVAATIGWTEERVHADLSFDELLHLTNEIWDVCVAGPASKMVGLLGRVTGTLGGPAALGAIAGRRPATKTAPPSSSQSDS